jgi:two-component system chemotaxis response regulator CheY
MKSLIVEDDNTCGFIFQSMLKKYGECDLLTSGFDAIRAYEASLDQGEPYECIIVDIMMPDMNGVEVLSGIRLLEKDRNIEFPFNVRVILTTALDDEVNRSIEANLDPLTEAYLPKSSYPDALLDKLTMFGFDLTEYLT